jgi:hypothetical protein
VRPIAAAALSLKPEIAGEDTGAAAAGFKPLLKA